MRSLYVKVCVALAVLAAGMAAQAAEGKAKPSGDVNIRDFADRVVGEDWSPAIQAAFDYVNAGNGYPQGATVFFPPGTYKIDKTVKLGKKCGYGVRLLGYGAVLLGTKTLDAQPLDYEVRLKALTEAKDDFSVMALPGELDFDGKNVGPAILELWAPPENEGSAYTIEGLTFDREAGGVGVGIKVPAETVPKNITFRSIKVYKQNVGVHINHCYQIWFDNCLIRGNQIGIWGRNHFNSVSIVNSEIRRQHLHGIVIGPNAGSWGSSAVYIAGCIFEETKGYGILNAGGLQVSIVNCYFEMVGNSIGILSSYGNTTVDTCHMWGGYGHGWNINKHGGQVVADKAHIVVDSPNVQLRNNRYSGAAPILLFGLGGKNSFDDLPVVAEGAKLADDAKAADSAGLGAYVYDAARKQFAYREWNIMTKVEAAVQEKEANKNKIAQLREALAAAKTADERIPAQLAIGDILVAEKNHEAAREEYQKAFLYPAQDQLEWRSTIQVAIAESYVAEENWAAAKEAYLKAQEIGLFGWLKDAVPAKLKEIEERAAKDAPPKPVCNVCGQTYDEAKGDPARGVAAGTKFAVLPADWTCPACGAKKDGFFVRKK